MANAQISLLKLSLAVLLLLMAGLSFIEDVEATMAKKKLTFVCYMNGDNNLAGEVLHAVDMMETVGSSEDVDIIVLVDGAPGNNGGYGPQWSETRLLHITKDDEIGVINSRVIAEMGEQNLGDPQVLEDFIKKALTYPSEKYVFVLFAHGRGIINTKSFQTPRGYKSVLLSPDDTGGRAMEHWEFKQAIENGLSEEKFELMLFFSCLTNMVEIGYDLRNYTRYIIGSQDEIRLVNQPEGTHQIRGVEAEILMERLTADNTVPMVEVGEELIDSFIRQYAMGDHPSASGKKTVQGRYPASLAMIDCQQYEKLSRTLDSLAKYLIDSLKSGIEDRDVLRSLHTALTASQNYPSFLNLEYFDLRDFLEKMRDHTVDEELQRLCQASLAILSSELIVYERHTEESRSHGVSIFFPNYLVPENIFEAHMAMYAGAIFSKETSWDELIETYRRQMKREYTALLIDEFERALSGADDNLLARLHSKISWALRKDVLSGKYHAMERYLAILKKMERGRTVSQSLQVLQSALQMPKRCSRVDEMRRTVEILLRPDNTSHSG